MPTSDNSQANEIHSYLSRLFKPGELIEYRALLWGGGGRGLYFTDLDRLAEVVAKLDQDSRVQSSYVVINPLKGRLIRERELAVNPTDEQVEQVIAGPGGQTASNDDIDILRWMFIDVDTVRAPGFEKEPATNEEKARSKAVAVRVLQFLKERGWPQPIVCDSGNGWHLLFLINLQNTPTNFHNEADCLKALKAKFDCEDANIDASVFNPARLTRAYGSTTRKGTNTPERPYRRNKMLDSRQPVGDVTLEMLLNLAVDSPGYSKGGGDLPELAQGFKPYDFIDHYVKQGAFEIEGEKEWQGNPILATNYCLFAGRKHSGDEFKSGFVIGDTFGYRCFSDDCEGLGLRDAQRILDEITNEDGSKKYIPFGQPIFEMDRIAIEQNFAKMLADGDIVLASEAEIAENQKKQDKVDEAMVSTKPAQEPEKPEEQAALGVPVEAPSPEPKDDMPKWVKGEKALDDLGIIVNNLATDVLRIVFHHPTEVWEDGFLLYMKRIKTKLGFNKKWKKPEDGEAAQQTLKMPIGETMKLLIKFAEAHKRLPDKATFAHFLNVSTDPEVMKDTYKGEVVAWVNDLEELPASMFDMTAQAFLDRLDIRAEIDAWRESFSHFLLEEHDIIGARMMLRKHFNISTTQDSVFEQGAWQERTDAIYASFEKNVLGVGDERKFRLGFPSIDNSGMNIGLDGDCAICLCGPASNRKTTAALSIAMNFAIIGKNGLFFAGEHQCMKVLKRLTLQLSHFFKDDPEIGHIPGLPKWEGLRRTATEEDLVKVKKLLLRLKSGEQVPGFIEPQNIDAVTRGEEDKVGALLQYAEATFPKYQWEFIVIDPLDTIMPPEITGVKGGPSNWKVCSGIIDRLFDFSRNAFGGKGCMVIVTAQFGSDARRDIEKIQQKNSGVENFDDELESILKRDGLIQYFTTIGQRFDLCLGIATRTKDGNDGLIVRGRDREGGVFNACYFEVNADTNYMREKKKEYKMLDKEQAKEAMEAAAQVERSFDPALAEEAQ